MGMMITFPIAYAVITQATSVSVAPRLPRISFRATFTIVVSIISSSVQMIAVIVMITRLEPYSTRESCENVCAIKLIYKKLPSDVNIHIHIHSCFQPVQNRILRITEFNLDGKALYDFHKISAGIIREKKRKSS